MLDCFNNFRNLKEFQRLLALKYTSFEMKGVFYDNKNTLFILDRKTRRNSSELSPDANQLICLNLR
jgi:hypothetical protein